MLLSGGGSVCAMASFLADMQHVPCIQMLGKLWFYRAAWCMCKGVRAGLEGTGLTSIALLWGWVLPSCSACGG